MRFWKRRRTSGSQCPECGGLNCIPILWGMPSPQMMKDAEKGRIVLGGCVLKANAPNWTCQDCNHRFGSEGWKKLLKGF